ncbi:hypothetical protein L1987_77663 [Smallanthus sonchifolius]|uniref:Uncharacterized protein n=1 Tax=Smallanthus sonchifolius TaxID=185202 RepID=A0ACB8Z9M9_9ASTR|nr:hypothetical protein L1987_77663 [Smallanthus sonchifolius]
MARAITVEKSAFNAFKPLKEVRSSFGAIELDGVARVKVFESAWGWVGTTTTTIISTVVSATIVVIGLSELVHKLSEESSKVIVVVVGLIGTTRRHAIGINKTGGRIKRL